MQPIIYLFFPGTCREAFETYGRVFDASPEVMSFADMPPEAQGSMPGVTNDMVMHASLKIGDGWIYGSDDPSISTQEMAGCNVSLAFPTEAETRRVWEALSEGGEIRMPLKPEFFAPLYGAMSDRFGIRWMIMQDGEAS